MLGKKMLQFFNNVLTKKRTLEILLQKCENSYGALHLWQMENIQEAKPGAFGKGNP